MMRWPTTTPFCPRVFLYPTKTSRTAWIPLHLPTRSLQIWPTEPKFTFSRKKGKNLALSPDLKQNFQVRSFVERQYPVTTVTRPGTLSVVAL